MNILSKRLQRLEQKCLEHQEQRSADVKSRQERLVMGAYAGLTDAELEHLSDFAQAHAVNPDARPNAEQQAALDAVERHHREFEITGRLQTVRGWPVDYSGQWPKVNGCSVGSYLDVSWWVEGIGYCLDLSPRKSGDDVPQLGSVCGGPQESAAGVLPTRRSEVFRSDSNKYR